MQDLGGRVEQGMRPTYAQLQEREKDLLAELEPNHRHHHVIRTALRQGIMKRAEKR